MPLRFDARVEWRSSGKSDRQEGIPIPGMTPGASTTGWESLKVPNKTELATLIMRANGSRMLTLAVATAYAARFFAAGRVLDYLSIAGRDPKTNNVLALVTCSGCKVAKSAPFSPKQGEFQGLPALSAVTLDFHDNDDGLVVQ